MEDSSRDGIRASLPGASAVFESWSSALGAEEQAAGYSQNLVRPCGG